MSDPREMTMGEAEAWRTGWLAAQAQAGGIAETWGTEDDGHGAACRGIADAIFAMPLPEPMRPRPEPTGLEFRGG